MRALPTPDTCANEYWVNSVVSVWLLCSLNGRRKDNKGNHLCATHPCCMMQASIGVACTRRPRGIDGDGSAVLDPLLSSSLMFHAGWDARFTSFRRCEARDGIVGCAGMTLRVISDAANFWPLDESMMMFSSFPGGHVPEKITSGSAVKCTTPGGVILLGFACSDGSRTISYKKHSTAV